MLKMLKSFKTNNKLSAVLVVVVFMICYSSSFVIEDLNPDLLEQSSERELTSSFGQVDSDSVREENSNSKQPPCWLEKEGCGASGLMRTPPCKSYTLIPNTDRFLCIQYETLKYPSNNENDIQLDARAEEEGGDSKRPTEDKSGSSLGGEYSLVRKRKNANSIENVVEVLDRVLEKDRKLIDWIIEEQNTLMQQQQQQQQPKYLVIKQTNEAKRGQPFQSKYPTDRLAGQAAKSNNLLFNRQAARIPMFEARRKPSGAPAGANLLFNKAFDQSRARTIRLNRSGINGTMQQINSWYPNTANKVLPDIFSSIISSGGGGGGFNANTDINSTTAYKSTDKSADGGEPPALRADSFVKELIYSNMESIIDKTECQKSLFSFKATKSDGAGNKCTGLVTASICQGGCDTGQFADYVFPHKKSVHKVCTHGKKVRKLAILNECSSDSVEPEVREYHYVDALSCVCKLCSRADTTCLGSVSRPRLPPEEPEYYSASSGGNTLGQT